MTTQEPARVQHTPRTLIKDLDQHVGKQVRLQGWVQDVRDLSKVKFVILRDRTGDMQCIALAKGCDPETFAAIPALSKESVVTIEGTVQKNAQSRYGIEVVIASLSTINASQTPLPIDNTDKSTTEIEKRLDYRFLDTRNLKTNAIFRIRSRIARSLTDFFDDEGFTNVNTPKITCIGVESGAQLFEVRYFDRPAYLAQSPQIYKQMLVAGGFERVFELGVVFRAENSNTTRHLTEFTGIDFEMGFIDDYTDVMDTIERMIIDLLEHLSQSCSRELALLGVALDIPKGIPRISMAEAKEYLKTKGKTYRDEDDLDPEGERLIGEMVKEKFGSDFVFVTLFPWAVRPFYHMRPDGQPQLTKSFDMLFRGVEIATGAQREHRYDVLAKQAKEKGLDLETMKEYADIFKYGIPPHGGVGFGLDRLTQRLLNLANVREAVLLPRDPKRLAP